MVPVSLVPEAIEQLPSFGDLIVSPGFAGVAALLAAIIALCAVLYASRRATNRFQQQLEQRDRHHEEAREDERHAEAVAQCWERLVWLVETAGIEPAASEGATLGLGPELALELLRGLLRDAKKLGDDTLAKAAAVYLHQLGLVLAQQGGPLPELAAASSPAPSQAPSEAPSEAKAQPNKQPASSPDEKHDVAAATGPAAGPATGPAAGPATGPATAADETPPDKAEPADAVRRRPR